MSATINQLIINSPYEEPKHYWSYDRETRTFTLKQGRRPAGYVRASESSKSFDDPGVFVELPLVNQIRERVKTWREHPTNPYAGVTGITQRLLEHWYDPEQRETRRLFFCQLEAIETLIWLVEAPPSEHQGIEIPGDGGEFTRLCFKMATGSGKTIVMAMLIAWQILNKITYPQDKRFSKNIFVVAPGLTVKSRLQVLLPAGPGNYYDEFNVIPPGFHDKLRQGKVLIRNWHALMPLDPDAGPKVMKKGAESDEAFIRRVLGEMANAHNLVVINDEAHHAWRVPPKSTIAREEAVELETTISNGDDEEESDEQPIKKLSKKDQAELLRQTVDTVGQVGKPGEQIQKVISVGMLSEGWDAKTVTHVMGLRAFSSQLLCEQVVGRGLRRHRQRHGLNLCLKRRNLKSPGRISSASTMNTSRTYRLISPRQNPLN